MQKNRKLVAVIAVALLLSLLLPVGISAEEFPDGATVYFYDVHGTGKEIITELVDNDSGTLLKTMDMFGPAGEYFTQGIRMWGYDAVGSDFPWHMMVSAEMTSMSGSTSYDGGRSYYTQIGAKFTKLLSPATYEATVYYDPHTCVANVKHITVDQNGNESLYSSSTLNLTYDSYFSTSKRYISNHTLNSDYSATVSGSFEWSMLDSIPNLPEDSYTSRYHSPTWEDIEESYHDEREIDIIFKYTLNHYTVEYDANGGENAPEPQTKWYGIDLALSENVPTRDGYTFLGWHTSSTSAYALYEAGETYTSNSAKYFYAVWKENDSEIAPETYTVSYDANGGSGAPSDQTKTEGVNLTLSNLEPSRSGYTFLGWSRYSWSSTVYYEPGGIYSDDSDLTLYAVWEEEVIEPSLETYTVFYNANGGSSAPSSQTKTEGINLTLSYREPTYSGYTFLGWTKYSWSSTVYYEPGDTYSNDADIMLYAVWEEVPTEPILETYTVSYDANGGAGAPSGQIKTEGVDLILSYREPTYNGYTFLGWTKYSWSSTVYYESGGIYCNDADITLYAVWEEVSTEPILETYTVSYDANGGSGAPATQTKSRDVDLTLSTIEPTRSGYTFKGWDTDIDATSAAYSPGDRYTSNSTITLYAVWEKDNYEFSISNLILSACEINKKEWLDIEVRTDSWDKNNAYLDIPVQLYIDGSLISTEYVDFEAYGIAYVTFNINVGDGEGEHEVEVRVNWNNRSQESDSSNNIVSGGYTVRNDAYELGVDLVNPNADYIAGTTVITSFTISNDSETDVIPAMECKANFSAYYYNGSSKVAINSQDWTNVVIPKGGTNLIYFKWTVPETLAGKTVYCECVINSDSKLNENNSDNNTVTLTKIVGEEPVSQTPNTRYEGNTPSNYSKVSAPTEVTGSASWTIWEYTNGAFVQKKYGVRVSADNPQISPGVNCETAEYKDGEWTMKSGYGLRLEYTPTITTLAGFLTPSNDAYTDVQAVCARFPENKYLTAPTQYRTLIYSDGAWRFEKNDYADNSERVHFIPVWFNDGEYIISVTVTAVWTPAGMITAVRNANVINIDGTIYDDWYQG